MRIDTHADLLAGLADAAEAVIPVGAAGVHQLRQPTPADAPGFVLACNDATAARWTELPAPYDHSHAMDFIERMAPSGLVDGSLVAFTATDETDDVLAVVSLHRLTSDGTADVGFWTAPWARRRGVATAALHALARWAFEDLGLRRLTWRALVGNIASLHTATGAGFVPAGTQRAALRHREAYVDCWHACLMAADPQPVDVVRPRCAVEIAAGAWQLQPIVAAEDALVAEAALPVSACLPAGLWAVRDAVTGHADAVTALLVADDRGWVLSVETGAQSDPSAAPAGSAAVTRYARRALGLQLP